MGPFYRDVSMVKQKEKAAGLTSHRAPIMLEDPGLEGTELCISTAATAHVPSVEPYAPRLGLPFSSSSRQRSVLLLEPPEEECVVRKPRAVNSDVTSPLSPDIKRDVR
jgi:hypothetical protein